MKAHRLAMLAGAPLLMAGSADAGFTGIKAVVKVVPPGVPGVEGALVCNVLATFDRPGQDRFLAAAGTPNYPMDIHVLGGTFYQHPFGSDTAPLGGLLAVFPSLAFDSFVSIGAKAIGPPPYQSPAPLKLTPGWPGFGPGPLTGTNLGWANTPADPNTDPFNPDFYLGNGQVLIGQFTTLDGTGIVGMFRILVVSNDVATQLNVSFFHVPGPGAPLLLVTCLLSGSRRRRSPRPVKNP